jgi:signal transduction histidine kinase
MNERPLADYLGGQSDAVSKAWQRRLEHDAATACRDERQSELEAFVQHMARHLREATAEARAELEAAADARAARQLQSGASLALLHEEYKWLRHVIIERWSREGRYSADDAVRLSDTMDVILERSIGVYDQETKRTGEKLIRALGHDLRNPLNAATVGAAALLRSEPLTSRGQARLETIERANGRMARMIDNILDFAHAHFGDRLSITPVECDMRELAHSALTGLQEAYPERGLSLTGDGDAHGHWDPERVTQALANFLVSALERGQDPIVLDVSEASDQTSVVTSVSYRGTTPAQSLSSLFDAVAAAASRPADLGLFVACLIARAHGTACEAVSSDDCTTLKINWPRAGARDV